MTLNDELNKELFYGMLRIRRVQERIESLYLEDQMMTPVHLCIGQEAIAVGVCAVLGDDDFINSNHRGHGHYLAKKGNLKKLIAELHCRATGCSKGLGGSMHLVDTSIGHYGSSSIVGGGIPIGTGLGLAIKMKALPNVSVIFFGDGAAEEGVLYESINFAILKELPVIFIMENNKWAVCSHVARRQKMENVFHSTPEEFLLTAKIDGNDITTVYKTALRAVNRARNMGKPSFIECDTYRIMGHAGCASQEPEGYRNSLERKHWVDRCPVRSFRTRLIDAGTLAQSDIEDMEQQIEHEIDQAFDFALQSPLPDPSDLNNYLYCGI